jgi:hypothetical protein
MNLAHSGVIGRQLCRPRLHRSRQCRTPNLPLLRPKVSKLQFSLSEPGRRSSDREREIPDGWQEGKEYKSSWTPEERRELQEKENEAYLRQFQSEPIENYVTSNQSDHLRK